MSSVGGWPISSGHILFDSNTLGTIRKRGLGPGIRASLRAVDLRALPTELNLIEAYSAGDATADALVETLAELTGQTAGLPRPDELLRLAGEAFLRGENYLVLPSTEIDPALLGNRSTLRKTHLAYRDAVNRGNQRLHATAREKLQPLLKKEGIKPLWSEFPLFLDYWWRTETRHIFGRQTWSDVGLPEPYRPEILENVPSWNLMSEADAIAMYQGALAFDQPRMVQRMDQLQLPYLGGADRRVLVTSDGPFVNVARMVLERRHPLTRVQTLDEFLASSGL